jgi:hypothetical protein
MRTDHIIPSLDPPSPITFAADMALGTLADQIDLTIPLPMPCTRRALKIEIATPRLKRDAVQGMGLMRPGTLHNALFM